MQGGRRGAVAVALSALVAGAGSAGAWAQAPSPLPPVLDQAVQQVQTTAQEVVGGATGAITNATQPPPASTTPSPAPAATTPATTPAASPAPAATTTARAPRRAAPAATRRAARATTTRRATTATGARRAATRRAAATRRPASSTRTRPPRRTAAAPAPATQPGGLTRTIRDVVEVVPGWVRVALAALAALALFLGVRTLVLRRHAHTLERRRARLEEDVVLLEQALLPDARGALGSVAGASVAYRAAGGPGAGGDFYDAIALPGGRGAIVVGDLTGHGRDALAQTALVRYTLRAYLTADLEPRRALALAGRVLEEQLDDGQFATVLIAVHDPEAGTLTYAAAGHPPPILAGVGAAAPLDVAFSPAIGFGLPTGLRQTTVPFAAGAAACLFTDGLVEARGPGGQLGRPGLAGVVGALGPDDGAAAVLEAVRRAAPDAPDDMTVCILRGSATRPARRVEEWVIDAATLASGRARSFLTACGIDADAAEDALGRAEALTAEWGGAVLCAGGGIVDVLRPPADAPAALTA